MSFCAFAQLVTIFILWDLRLLMNKASFLTLNEWGYRLRLSLRQRHKYILSKIQFGLQMTSPEERRKCCVKKEKQRQTFVLQIRTLACCSSIRYNSSDFGSCNLKGPSMDPKYGTPQFSSQLEIIHVLNETTPEKQHRKWGPISGPKILSLEINVFDRGSNALLYNANPYTHPRYLWE